MFIIQQKNNLPIYNFTIFGERHSGTNFLEKLMTGKDSWGGISKNKAFNIPITWEYGWKHFFGFHDDLLQTEKTKNTLFIGLVRNPYDWLMAMYKMPHHLRQHRGPGWDRYDNLEDFLTCSDLLSRYRDPANNNEFHTDNNPYTLNGYKNIFNLRSIKLHYLLEKCPNNLRYSNYVLCRYEDLSNDSGLFIQKISEIFGIEISMIIQNKQKVNQYNIDFNYINIINENLNWDLENKCNYTIM
jgi:hypothetical protein